MKFFSPSQYAAIKQALKDRGFKYEPDVLSHYISGDYIVVGRGEHTSIDEYITQCKALIKELESLLIGVVIMKGANLSIQVCHPDALVSCDSYGLLTERHAQDVQIMTATMYKDKFPKNCF